MRRRRIGNKTLLAASVGAATLSFAGAGCKKEPPMHTGNLMAPPMVEICVTTDPPGGEVSIAESTVDARGCATIMQEGLVVVRASLAGYETKETQVPTDKPHTFTMRLKPLADGGGAPAPAPPDAAPE
ncbi:MAG: hypothetical protein EP329_19605 [Deltaproteobacteria bacterium]|nr:MAG: hypothetical protein EP329_19605 [Deltaproteobacteria bacterium]